MNIKFRFGKEFQEAEIPDDAVRHVLLPNDVRPELTGEAEVRRALAQPTGTLPLRQLVHPGEKIAIVTSDITRPMPTYIVLPLILDELYSAGIAPEDITLVFATGSHRKQTEEEKRKLAGERAWREIRCIDSDPEDFVHMGTTSAGTPVDIFRVVAEADRRICLGNIEYHYFAGYSGGAKAIMPGVSTFEAIQTNHRKMIEESASAGNLEGNPIREDIDEAVSICHVDFICNVILDEKKQIIKAVAGDVIAAHREGCVFVDSLYQVGIDQPADIVIASQGGAPKDINLYQTQKALDNAKAAVRDGGIIILVGSCKEGLGQKTFEEWLLEASSPHELIERISRDFRLGGHKAAAIAMVLERAEIYLVSEINPKLVEKMFMTPFSTVQEAYEAAARKLGSKASVIVMQYGGSTLPKIKN